MSIVARAEFYTDLVPITNDIITTSTDASIVTTPCASVLSSAITNANTIPVIYSSATQNNDDDYTDNENILTDSMSTAFHLTSHRYLTTATNTLPSTTIKPSTLQTNNSRTIKQHNITTSSPSSIAASTYTSNAAGSNVNIKTSIMVWGLVGYSLIWILL